MLSLCSPMMLAATTHSSQASQLFQLDGEKLDQAFLHRSRFWQLIADISEYRPTFCER